MSEARTSAETPAETSPRDLLLRTKLYRRAPLPSLVPRPRLVERLIQGLACRLVLVSAPAGFGKTTILAQWLDHCQCSVAWVSLDPTDDDPATFLRYLVAALQTVVPEVGRSVEVLLRSPEPPPLESILTVLLNDLASMPRELVLVLEDYHSITNPAIHSGVTYLLDHLPPGVHLVVATRADPPLPLARLRSRGDLVEVRADDLRFGFAEARVLLERTGGVRLTEEDSAALQTRTEGWAAGLQLAGLSLRGRKDVSRFVEEFAGSHRYVADYLLEEVLGRQPEGVQAFLLETSILDRLSGPLCDAVTGGTEGQGMLERLEAENLFLVPLDDERRWYRYHHLFADLLRSRLPRSDEHSARELHRRAAGWLDQQGYASEAVIHALAAADYGLAAQLVVRHWWLVTAGGQTATAYRWLASLPDDVVREHPWLAFASAWLCFLQGRFGEVESFLDAASQALDRLGPDDSLEHGNVTRAGIRGNIPALRSHLALGQGDVARALALAQESLELTPKGATLGQAHANGALATALEAKPDSAGAVTACERALALFREARNSLAIAHYTYYLTRLLIRRGELSRAEATCREALRLAEEGGLGELPAYRLVHTALADVFLVRAEVDAAEQALRGGLELDRGGTGFEDEKSSFIALARLQLARGDLAGALDTLQEAAQVVSLSGSQLAIAEVAAFHATALLRSGDLEGASGWSERAAARRGEDRGFVRELEALGIARVLIAKGQEAEALQVLEHLLAEAEEDGRAGSQIEILCLRAVARRAVAKVDQALGDLQRALALGQAEGYARVFLDEGPALVDLLRRGVSIDRWSRPTVAFACRLIDVLEPAKQTPSEEVTASALPDPSPRGPSSQPLLETLSDRERQVLRLMAEGLTNEQIGVRLIIALGTVKAHVHNISGKLGVRNRAQAVARGKELNLL